MCKGHERCSCNWRTYHCDNCDEIETTDGDLPEGWTNDEFYLCPACTNKVDPVTPCEACGGTGRSDDCEWFCGVCMGRKYV